MFTTWLFNSKYSRSQVSKIHPWCWHSG